MLIFFARQSERQVSLFRAKDLKEMTTLAMDVSPTILRPFHDEDSSTLFLTGKVRLSNFSLSCELNFIFSCFSLPS